MENSLHHHSHKHYEINLSHLKRSVWLESKNSKQSDAKHDWASLRAELGPAGDEEGFEKLDSVQDPRVHQLVSGPAPSIMAKFGLWFNIILEESDSIRSSRKTVDWGSQRFNVEQNILTQKLIDQLDQHKRVWLIVRNKLILRVWKCSKGVFKCTLITVISIHFLITKYC